MIWSCNAGALFFKLATEWFDSQSWLEGRTKIHSLYVINKLSYITLFRMQVEMQRSGYE